MRGITLFSKNSGLEVAANDVVKKDKKLGAITLRFFNLENGKSQMRFIMNPIEAFSSYLNVKAVCNSTTATKKSVTHKFEKEGQEIVTVLSFEQWVRNEKSGFAVTIKRDNDSINVPMDIPTFVYLGELLKYLSTQQAWVNQIEAKANQAAATGDQAPTTEADLDIFDELAESEEEELEPVEKSASNASSGNAPATSTDTPIEPPVANGIISAVRKDKKGFKLGESWYSVNDKTKIEGEEIDKGRFAVVSYRNGNNGTRFANLVTIAETV